MPDTGFDFNVFTAMQLASAAYKQSDDITSVEGLNTRTNVQLAQNRSDYNELFGVGTGLTPVTRNELSVADTDGYFIRENGAALLARAGDTLYISFRGTNDNPATIFALADAFINDGVLPDFASQDVEDWFDMDRHFGLFSELFTALPGYLNDNGISKIQLFGHSLGGGMVQKAFLELRENPDFSGIELGGIAFAPPGYERGSDFESNDKVRNIFFENDPLLSVNSFTSSVGNQLIMLSSGTGSHDVTDYLNAASLLLETQVTTVSEFIDPENARSSLQVALRVGEDGTSVGGSLGDVRADLIIGTNGDDDLQVSRTAGKYVAGLEGNDEIFLSSRADTVIFSSGHGSDTIRNFNPSEDTLLLFGYDAPLDVQISSFNVFPFSFETTVNFGEGDSITFLGLDIVEVRNVLNNNVIFVTGSSDINVVGIDTDGPTQSRSGEFFDADDDPAGTVSLSAPTFTGDGDVDYTISIGGIGRGTQFNIAYIFDVSGSMAGQRIDDARSAYIALTNELIDLGFDERSNFALVRFNVGAAIDKNLSAADLLPVLESVDVANLGFGFTGSNIGTAIEEARDFFSSANPGISNVAYVISDGAVIGATDALADIANVQAFGVGEADIDLLDIVDSDNAVLLDSSAQLVDALTGANFEAEVIDGIAISVDGNVVHFITPDQLADGPLGLQYTGTIAGLDISPDAQNEVSATVFLKGVDGAKGSTTLSIASAFGDTTVTQSGDEADVVLSAFDANYNADEGGASNVRLLANNLSNEIVAINTGGTFSLFGGDDYFLSSQTAGDTIDRVIDGGDGYDVVEYIETYNPDFVRRDGGILRVGENSDSLTNVEEIRFSDASVLTNDLSVNFKPTQVALAPSTVDENSAAATVVGAVTVTDPDAGDTHTLTLVDDAGGRFALDGTDIVVASGAMLDFETDTSHTVTVRATDAGGLSVEQGIEIAVNDVNDAPVGVDDSYTTAFQTALTIGAAGVLGNDTDVEGDTLSAVLDSGPANGTLTLNADGSFSYSPDAGFSGSDTFTYFANDGTADAVAPATVTVTVTVAGPLGTDGPDDIFNPLGGQSFALGGGSDIVRGPVENFFGDVIEDFDLDDTLVFEGTEIARSAIDVTFGSAIFDVDTDGDGSSNGQFTLEGDFSSGDFMAVADSGDTLVTFETFLPVLQERQAVDPDLVNGIINQNFLKGDGATDFQVTLRDLGFAGYDNVLGVYEIDAGGNIVDTRILFDNANADKSASTLIEDVEDGHNLGFFIVQDAADWAANLADSDTLSFVDSSGDAANISDGADISIAVNSAAVDEMVFHSFDETMNSDGVKHALSGVEVGGEAITIGFEDLTGGGDRDYEDVAFRVELVDDLATV